MQVYTKWYVDMLLADLEYHDDYDYYYDDWDYPCCYFRCTDRGEEECISYLTQEKVKVNTTSQKIPVSSDEYDAFSGWRHYYGWGPGTLKKIKRQYNRRVRHLVKEQLRRVYSDHFDY